MKEITDRCLRKQELICAYNMVGRPILEKRAGSDSLKRALKFKTTLFLHCRRQCAIQLRNLATF